MWHRTLEKRLENKCYDLMFALVKASLCCNQMVCFGWNVLLATHEGVDLGLFSLAPHLVLG